MVPGSSGKSTWSPGEVGTALRRQLGDTPGLLASLPQIDKEGCFLIVTVLALFQIEYNSAPLERCLERIPASGSSFPAL